MVGIFVDEIGEGVVVDLSYLGADLFELRIASELGSWGGATVVVLDGLAGVVALQGQGDAGVAPSGAVAFPDDESSSSRGCSCASTASHRSVMTDSGVELPPRAGGCALTVR